MLDMMDNTEKKSPGISLAKDKTLEVIIVLRIAK
jgi:hypothetical protein